MNTELELLKKEVHAKGFNISMMINTFKKKQRERKATYEVPDSVYCAVCRAYLSRNGAVERDFPYFLRVLAEKAKDDCGANTAKSAKESKFGKMPEKIKEMFK